MQSPINEPRGGPAEPHESPHVAEHTRPRGLREFRVQFQHEGDDSILHRDGERLPEEERERRAKVLTAYHQVPCNVCEARDAETDEKLET